MRKPGVAVGIAILTCTVGLAACGGGSKKTAKSTSTTVYSGQTRTVNVDGTTDKFIGAFLGYFPNMVTVHPGDTVAFKEVWTGEPHTVTMGTLVEKGLAAVSKSNPNSNAPIPDYDSLPTLIGQDLNASAAQPCYLSTGAPPSDASHTACAKTGQPDFTGNQTYYNSGLLQQNTTFSVRLSKDIAPGTYHFYCNLHGPSMSGSIQVVSADKSIPSQSDVDSSAASQLKDLVDKLTPDYTNAQSGQFPFPGVIHAAGDLDQNVETAVINEFFPKVINIAAGDSVSWTFLGAHTLSFNAPAGAQVSVQVGTDGMFHLNPLVAQPAGGAPPPPNPGAGGPPPSGPPTPKSVDAGSWNGQGFWSTGIVQSFPGSPAFSTYHLTFSQSGTYTYTCLLHPGMIGTVVVS